MQAQPGKRPYSWAGLGDLIRDLQCQRTRFVPHTHSPWLAASTSWTCGCGHHSMSGPHLSRGAACPGLPLPPTVPLRIPTALPTALPTAEGPWLLPGSPCPGSPPSRACLLFSSTSHHTAQAQGETGSGGGWGLRLYPHNPSAASTRAQHTWVARWTVPKGRRGSPGPPAQPLPMCLPGTWEGYRARPLQTQLWSSSLIARCHVGQW